MTPSLSTPSISHRRAASRHAGLSPDRIRELAEAGARGQALTAGETRAICEALQARSQSVRNQFHSGH